MLYIIKKTRTEVMLGNTARKLKLKKISSMFEPVCTGESKTKTENADILHTLDKGMSWAGAICTVQREDAVCVSQSGELEKGVTKRHLRFGGTLDYDWTEGAVKEIGLEDVIGSGLGDGQLLANQRGDFQK